MSATVSIDRAFEELLLTELRRQGFTDASAWHAAILRSVRWTERPSPAQPSAGSVDDGNGAGTVVMSLNCSNMGLNDRIIIAVVEALLKLSLTAQTAVPPNAAGQRPIFEWAISFANNKLTDRVAPHLELLLARCASLSKLDLSMNAFSPAGLLRINESYSRLAAKPLLLLDGNKAPVGGGETLALTSGATTTSGSSGPFGVNAAAQQQAPQAGQPAQAGPRSVATTSSGGSIDIAAWKRRRDQLLREEGLRDTAEAVAERDRLAREMGLETSFGDVAVSEGRSSSSLTRTPQQSTAIPLAASRAVPAALQQHVRAPAAQPAPRQLAAKAVSAPPQAAQRPTAAPAKQAAATHGSSTSSDEDSVAQRGATGGPPHVTSTATDRERHRHRHRRPSPVSAPSDARREGAKRSASISSSSSASPPPAKGLTKSNTAPSGRRESGTSSNQQQQQQHRRGAESDEDEEAKTSDGSSGDTQATEVADKQDLLDITAEVGVLDVVRDLNGCGLLPSVIFAYDSLQHVTVLNIANNALAGELPAGVLPPTLTRLDASNNELTSLGTSLFQCKLLAVLNLRRNRLSVIGDALRHCVAIAHLFLGRNSLSSLFGISHLIALEVLDISFNNLRTESSLRCLSMHPNLRHLICNNNPVFLRTARKGSNSSAVTGSENSKPPSTFAKNPRAALRNLIPSLVALDNERLAFSRQAALSISAFLNYSAAPGNVSLPTALGAVGSSIKNATGPSGYSAPGQVQQKMAQIERTRRAGRDVQQSKVRRAPVSRKEVLAGIAAQNKTRLEEAVVDRLSSMQPSADRSHSAAPAAHDRDHDDSADGSDDTKRDHGARGRRSSAGTAATTATATTGGDSAQFPNTSSRGPSQPAVRSQTLDHDRWEEQRRREALSSSPIFDADSRPGGARRRSSSQHAGAAAAAAAMDNGDRGVTSPGSAAAAEAFLRNVQLLSSENRRHQRTFSGGGDSDIGFADNLSDEGGSAAPARGPAKRPAQAPIRSGGGAGAATKRPALMATTSDFTLAQSFAYDESTCDAMDAEDGSPTAAGPLDNSFNKPAQEKRETPVYPLLASSAVGGGNRGPGGPGRRPIAPVASPPQPQHAQGAGGKLAKTPHPALRAPSPQQQVQQAATPASAAPNTSRVQRALVHDEPASPIYRDPNRTDVSLFPRTPQTAERSSAVTAVPSAVKTPAMLSSDASAAVTPTSAFRSGRSALMSPPPVAATARGPVPAQQRTPLPHRGSQQAQLHANTFVNAAADSPVVSEWLKQLQQDAVAIRIAFRTLLVVLQSEDGGTAEERRRCLDIIRRSGMLEDTEIPAAVVDAFGFTEAELNQEPGAAAASAPIAAAAAAAHARSAEGEAEFMQRRQRILSRIFVLGESKTCMRYIVALVENNREDLLAQYLDRIKDVIPTLTG